MSLWSMCLGMGNPQLQPQHQPSTMGIAWSSRHRGHGSTQKWSKNQFPKVLTSSPCSPEQRVQTEGCCWASSVHGQLRNLLLESAPQAAMPEPALMCGCCGSIWQTAQSHTAACSLMVTHGGEQPFGQLGSAVPALPPSSLLCTPRLRATGAA